MVKQEFYTQQILNTLSNGWGTSHQACYLIDGNYSSTETLFDRSWGQGFYGIFVSKIKDDALKTKLIGDFVKGTNDMLKRSNGVFLRDNSEAAFELYKTNTSWENSKDQTIGLVCALFAMYQSTTHEILLGGIRDIIKQLNEILVTHGWSLYNDKAKRLYNSAYYCQIHYWGLRSAFDYILRGRKISALETILFPIQTLPTKGTLEMTLNTKEKKYWWQNLQGFNKFPWYGDYFRCGMFDFNLNLSFFEMYIVGTISKANAQWCITELELPMVMQTNNLNLAFLYFYLTEKWGIVPKHDARNYYNKLRVIDEVLHPENILPNEAGIGCDWHGDEGRLFSHQIYNYFDSPIVYNREQSMGNLISYSKGRKIRVNNGLTYMARQLI